MRALVLRRRAALDAEARRGAAVAAAEHAVQWLGAVADETIALFAPIGSEIATAPLAERLRAGGARLALPVVVGMEDPLQFRFWDADVPLIASRGPGKMAIPAPPADAPIMEPDIVFVPLAAFDARGHRLGYGAGHYDRTLAKLRAAKRIEAIGYAFAVQELSRLPDEPHDERLDAVITDAGVICPEDE
ncbi:5-formyltetrahydrofolate cyclo-ligase [Ancylobacter terrae]|uniref:5-formyltetrahydrofolate cyclo-ligase n=1 Tax=Ancylobacter sp. sgz301288 TaxID=3342077 RepID=UPI003858F9F1